MASFIATTVTIPARDAGTCPCGSDDLEADVAVVSGPAYESSGTLHVLLYPETILVRCRRCGLTDPTSR